MQPQLPGCGYVAAWFPPTLCSFLAQVMECDVWKTKTSWSGLRDSLGEAMS